MLLLNRNWGIKIFFLFTIATISWFALKVHAETISPQFLVSWQAQNYAPTDFAGKKLPIEKTPLAAAFEILSNGKFLDLSSVNVAWLVNGTLVAQAPNQKRFTTTIKSYADNSINIEIRIPSYKGAALSYDFSIPVVSPQVTIKKIGESHDAGIGNKLDYTAKPYFFNIKNLSDLSFNWRVNGQTPTEKTDDPQNIFIIIPPGSPSGTKVDINLAVKSNLNDIETAEQNLIYTTP